MPYKVPPEHGHAREALLISRTNNNLLIIGEVIISSERMFRTCHSIGSQHDFYVSAVHCPVFCVQKAYRKLCNERHKWGRHLMLENGASLKFAALLLPLAEISKGSIERQLA